MGRPIKNTVEYFPHYASGKGMYYVESRHGNDGYAVWCKLLEELAKTEYHVLDFNDETNLIYLATKCRVTEDKLIAIIGDICRVDGFDKILWESRFLWSEKFSESVTDAYKRRSNVIANRDFIVSLCIHKSTCSGINVYINPQKDYINTQTKVEYSKVKESRVDETSKFTPKPTPTTSTQIDLTLTDFTKNPQAYRDAYEAWRTTCKSDRLFIDTYCLKHNAKQSEIIRLIDTFQHHLITTDKAHATISSYKRHFSAYLGIKEKTNEINHIFRANIVSGE